MIYHDDYRSGYLKSRIRSLKRLVADNLIGCLNIELSSACNLSCVFCPSHNKRQYRVRRKKEGLMSKALFKCIVNDNSINLPVKTLVLHKDGESLLNRNIAEFIVLAKKMYFAETITVTTNGILLTSNKLKELEDSGLDSINISIDTASRERYFQLKGSAEYDLLEQNVFRILTMRWKLESINLTFIDFNNQDHSEIKLILQKYGRYAEGSKKINIIFTNYHDWSGHTDSLQNNSNFACDYPWYGMSVNYDGTVSVCCVDWNSNLLIGDLARKSLGDIWNGKKLRRIREVHLSGDLSSLPICQKCTYKPNNYRVTVGQWIKKNIRYE